MRPCFRRSELERFGPRTSLNTWSATKLRLDLLCATARADSESADDNRDRGGPMSRSRPILLVLACESPVG
eukprot:2838558-Alexandrium_andersonii.AAC.1